MLLAAAGLLLALGIAHSYLGERYILVRLFKRTELPRLFGGTTFTIGTLRFAWHLTTVAWWALAYLLVAASHGPLSRNEILLVVAVTSLVSAALPLYFTRGRHLSWLVFIAVAGLALLCRSQ